MRFFFWLNFELELSVEKVLETGIMCIVKDVGISKSVFQPKTGTNVFVILLINIGLSMDDSNACCFGILRDVGQYFTMGGKKMKIKFLAIMFAAILVLGACGGNKAVEKNTATPGTETVAVDAEKIVNTSCITCHGGNLEGKGNAPALAKVGDHMSETEIRDVIVNGRGGMPAGLIKGEEADAVAKWLAEKNKFYNETAAGQIVRGGFFVFYRGVNYLFVISTIFVILIY